MRIIALVFTCLLAVTACNQVDGLQPVKPGAVPSVLIRHVTDQFPQAENLVFKPLLEKRVWEVKFDAGNDKYESLVDSLKIWETMRYNPDELPAQMTDLMNSSAFKGGTFSENREAIGFYNTGSRRNKNIYTFHGTDYIFDWLNVDGKLAGAMFQRGLYLIGVQDQKQLPDKIQRYLAENAELKFRHAELRVLLNYENIFEVEIGYVKDGRERVVYLYFDNNADLKCFTWGFNEPQSGGSPRNFDQIPDKIQQYLDESPELADFQTSPVAGYQWMSEYKGVKSYTIKFRHKVRSEECEFRFDMDGNLFYKMYFFNN